ncbi:MAG: hypothetical protein E7Z87_00715 [Cyanobacteria bacterium SIG26]|nr:hypothetical protein [Cyanobacteria bacterium SIG26]
MSIISKLFTPKTVTTVQEAITPKSKQLPNRYTHGGIVPCGANTLPQRTDSLGEIVDSLEIQQKNQRKRSEQYLKEVLESLKSENYDFEKVAKQTGKDVRAVICDYVGKAIDQHNQFVKNGGRVSNEAYKKLLELQRIARSAISSKAAEIKSNEIGEFIKSTKGMPQRHASLAHDIVDLSCSHKMISDEVFPEVNLNDIGFDKTTNKEMTRAGYALKKLAEASKRNPAVADLAEAVATHSGDTNSKYFIPRFLENTDFQPEQLKATEELIPYLSKSILKGMPSMDLGANSKENQFLNIVNALCSSDSKPENLKLLKQIYEITDADGIRTDHGINIDTIRLGDNAKMKENMDALREVIKNAEAKQQEIDVAEFLTKNVNMD